jgi:outer membrane protein OmpA-like peptidoglycan-associated protein
MALSHSSAFKFAGQFACVLLVVGLIWPVNATPAAAQDVPADQIIKALTPPPLTRGLSPTEQPAASEADRDFIDGIRHRARSLSPLSPDERDHVAELAKNRRKWDLVIYFDFNSAVVKPQAEWQLNELGKALGISQFADTVFVLGGHTDAKGGDEYNQKLSERRAEAVKAYLMTKLKIPAQNLATAGFGKRDLKNPAEPFAAENRRVQIVNLGTSNEAKR